ncbi:hypothetical protein V8G54_023426 [Vigna mungo]|uniref:Uncharacterized protein n=1 Tax=Vigna mungo TaxID=3915 RepID=A0AAQ3N567_VIGMU
MASISLASALGTCLGTPYPDSLEFVLMQKQDHGDHSPTVLTLRKCLLSPLLPRRLPHSRPCPVLAQNHIFLLCQNAYNPSQGHNGRQVLLCSYHLGRNKCLIL